MYVYLHQRTLGMCGCGTVLRAWFPSVHYLEVNLYWKVTLGAGLLSAIWKRFSGCYDLEVFVPTIDNDNNIMQHCIP